MFADTPGATIFPTGIGDCGVVWTTRGVHSSHLPVERRSELRAVLERDTTGGLCKLADAPDAVRAVAARIDRLTRGADDTLGDVPLDRTGVSDFAWSIYQALRRVPPGDVVTYGDLAHRAGHHGSNMPRAVGQVLGRNPYGIIVPCHRVIAADGRIGGFSAYGGNLTKLRLLRSEGRGEAAAPMPYDVASGEAFLRAADPLLAGVIDRIPATPRMRPTTSTFAGLAEAIVGQQVSAAAASSIFARLCLLFPRPLEGPTPEGTARLEDTELRAAGLSASKVASLRDLTARTLAGEVPGLDELAGMGDEQIIGLLTPIRGIGRWTVEMLLIFRLGRPDVLPVDDLAVRRGYEHLAGIDQITPSALRARGERWAPWRSLASWYLWRASELT